jgi:DNA-binding transcriptional ArsR family regulator
LHSVAIKQIKIYFREISKKRTAISTNQDIEKAIPAPLSKILSEESAIRILKSAASTHKSAYELSKDCQISLTTIYRQIKRLNDMRLLTISGSIDVSGKKHFMYKSKETVYCKCACSHIDLSNVIKKE